MTTVKYERALPNNEIFTKKLVEENRELLIKTREMELRLFRVRFFRRIYCGAIIQTSFRSNHLVDD